MTQPETRGAAVARLCAEYVALFGFLFVVRFMALGHLIPRTDQECHIGGIAVDVLARGVRFPLLAYAPNEYDNGSFFSGLLAAGSFAVLGRSTLALKLVTHSISTAGVLAMLVLLRGCLDELRLTGRKERWPAIAALLVATALAPRIVTLASLHAVGNHAEGAAIDVLLLALFTRRFDARSPLRTAAVWALAGVALYLNKGTVIAIAVMGIAELELAVRSARAPRRWGRPAAALGGLLVGLLPEVAVVARRHGAGWMGIAGKAARNSARFPEAQIDSLSALVDGRPELLVAFALALVVGIALILEARAITLSVVVSFTVLHLVAMLLMAQGKLDRYVLYGHATLAVLLALLVGVSTARAAARWGPRAGVWAAGAGVALVLVLHRPGALTLGTERVSTLWRDHAGAACAWRFAEGFGREQQYGLAEAGQSRVDHMIERCRSLTEEALTLDCIGGIARELHWRHQGKVLGAPPASLTESERRAYAFHYGIHRRGELIHCDDFDDAELEATCRGAVRLDCLDFGEMYSGFVYGRGIGRPACDVPEPPMDGFWAALRRDVTSRTDGVRLELAPGEGGDGLEGCKPVLDACY